MRKESTGIHADIAGYAHRELQKSCHTRWHEHETFTDYSISIQNISAFVLFARMCDYLSENQEDYGYFMMIFEASCWDNPDRNQCLRFISQKCPEEKHVKLGLGCECLYAAAHTGSGNSCYFEFDPDDRDLIRRNTLYFEQPQHLFLPNQTYSLIDNHCDKYLAVMGSSMTHKDFDEIYERLDREVTKGYIKEKKSETDDEEMQNSIAEYNQSEAHIMTIYAIFLILLNHKNEGKAEKNKKSIKEKLLNLHGQRGSAFTSKVLKLLEDMDIKKLRGRSVKENFYKKMIGFYYYVPRKKAN